MDAINNGWGRFPEPSDVPEVGSGGRGWRLTVAGGPGGLGAGLLFRPGLLGAEGTLVAAVGGRLCGARLWGGRARARGRGCEAGGDVDLSADEPSDGAGEAERPPLLMLLTLPSAPT